MLCGGAWHGLFGKLWVFSPKAAYSPAPNPPAGHSPNKSLDNMRMRTRGAKCLGPKAINSSKDEDLVMARSTEKARTTAPRGIPQATLSGRGQCGWGRMTGFHPACTDTAFRPVVHMGGGAGDSGGLAVPRRLGTWVVQECVLSVQVQLTKCMVSFPYFTSDPKLRRIE